MKALKAVRQFICEFWWVITGLSLIGVFIWNMPEGPKPNPEEPGQIHFTYVGLAQSNLNKDPINGCRVYQYISSGNMLYLLHCDGNQKQ